MNEVYVDGKWVRGDKAVLPAFHTGLLYGESVFEAVPFYGGRPLFWEDHLRRLGRGCRFLGWPAPGPAKLRRAVSGTWRRWTGGDCGILRLNYVAPLGPSDSPSRPHPAQPVLLAAFRPLRHDPDAEIPFALVVGVASWRVPDAKTYPFGFKTAFYLTVRSDLKAHPAWQEMLRLNPRGFVVDGAFSSPLLLFPGEVWAPMDEACGLESVTRRRVLSLCARWGWRVRRRAWTPKDCFRRGGELVFVGSGIGVAGARYLAGRSLAAPGPGTGRLWNAYRQWIRQTRDE
jgi:branched-subunit amino acid aminotransferase/4-amino-4-deoxychorismate lyase